MKIIEYLKENHSAMRSGLPIELKDLIDERGVYTGSYEDMIEFLECPGLEHVRNATFVLEDIFNDQNRIMLYYVKEIHKYDEFDLRQFAAKVIRMEKSEASLEERLAAAVERSGNKSKQESVKDDYEKQGSIFKENNDLLS